MFEEILKWTFLVLAAGFVGYFGRYLAMELIRRMRGADSDTGESGRDDGAEQAIASAKLEKKRRKAETKLKKKHLKNALKGEDK